MTDESHSNVPTDKAVDDLAKAAEQEATAVEEVVDEVHDTVADTVGGHAETAAEAATEAAEVIEDAVESAVEAAPDLDERHAEEVYNRVMQRLEESGVMSPAVAEEVAGDAEHVVEESAAVPVEAVSDAADTISPTREHWWFRPRKIGRRSV